jgi:hypothetical protein
MNLRSIGQQLLKKLRLPQVWGPEQTSSGQLPAGGMGDPIAPPATTRPITPLTYSPSRPNPSVLADAQAMQSEALNILRQPAPAMQPARVNGAEAGLGTLFGLLLENPAARSKAFNAPYALAESRADIANTNAANAFNQQQRTAQALLGHSQKVIAEWYDRDQAADKIEADMRKAELAGKVREFAAKAKNDGMLVKSLAQLAATGGVTVPGVKEILSMLDPEAPEDELDAKAAEIVNQVNTNPSMQARMKMAQLEVSQQKATQDEVQNLWTAAQRPNATWQDRYQIYQRLQTMGQINPQADILAMAREEGAQTKNLNAKTEYTEMKTKLEPHIFEQRKQEFDRRLAFLQSSHKDKLAVAWSRVQVSRTMAGIAQQNANTAEGRLALAELKLQLETEENEAFEAFNEAMDDLEQKLAGETNEEKIAKLKAEIAYIQDQYWGGIASSAGVTRDDVAADPFGAARKVYDEATKKPALRGGIGNSGRGTAQQGNPPAPQSKPPQGKPKKSTTKKPSGFGNPR